MYYRPAGQATLFNILFLSGRAARQAARSLLVIAFLTTAAAS